MTVNNATMGATMRQVLFRRRVGAALATVALTAAIVVVQASPASAGMWMRTNCVNPDGTPSGSDGWTGFSNGVPSIGSTNKSTCAPNDPMIAFLSTAQRAPGGAAEGLRYTPPDGSTLVGGTLLAGLIADGAGHGPPSAIGTAAIFTPDYAPDLSNIVLVCAFLRGCIPGDTPSFYGEFQLPTDRGGNLYLAAACVGGDGSYCYQGGSHNAWSLVAVAAANLLLSSSALPTASDFRGSLLDPGAHGTAGIAFTAGDDGPGVFKVTVTLDDEVIYDATPNTNAGKCVPGGSDPGTGALYFEWQQPCPQSQTVDLTVRTTPLRDGPHELKVVVLDAAQNSSTVLRQTITTNNRTTVSGLLTSDRPASGTAGVPAPEYAVELDQATRKLARGVARGWTHSGLELSGTLRSATGVPAPGVLVTLFARHAAQTSPEVLTRGTSDAAGHWVLAAPRGPSRLLTIAYGEQPDPASARAIKFRETVTPRVTLRVRALGRGRLRFSGRVGINPLGRPRPLAVVQTRTRNGKHWQAVGSSLRVSSSGRYSVIYDGGPNVIGGRYAFRTVVNATPLFATGVSPITRKVVR